MTPEKRAELTKQLADQGLTVLLTKDFDSILIQLARLAQFERLMYQVAKDPAGVDHALERIRAEQQRFVMEGSDSARPMEILDVPTILAEVHTALYDQLGNHVRLDYDSIHAATAAFIGIIIRR